MSSTPVWTRTYELTTENEGANNFELRAPARGTIVGVTVVQESGVDDGFEVGLYDSRQAAPPNTEGSSASSAASGVSALNFEVFPRKTVAPGARALQERDVEYAYVNRDGSPSNLQRKLYLQIEPNGDSPKEFTVTLMITSPHF